MAISKNIEAALNEQLKHELASSYLYLAMAAWLHTKNLPGCASWMRVQAQEELMHGMKVHDFILDRDGTVNLMTVDAPKSEWNSVVEVFREAFAHEQAMTKLLNDLTDVAIGEKDHATHSMLRWFVDEQVEEEATLSDIVNKFELIGESGSGLYMIDRELASRAPEPLPA